jgi:hypothetical protein
MVDCTDMNDGADHGDPTSGSIMKFDDPAWDRARDREGGENLGVHSTVQTNSIVYRQTKRLRRGTEAI